jgi:hypothetical protein
VVCFVFEKEKVGGGGGEVLIIIPKAQVPLTSMVSYKREIP